MHKVFNDANQLAASGFDYTAYDALGRVTASDQTTDGQLYSFLYGYNLAGSLTSETYPSGRVVTTSYGATNQVSQVTGNYGTQVNYFSNPTYAASGQLTQYRYGNNLWRQATYGSLLLPSWSADMVNNSTNQQLFAAIWNWAGNGNLKSMSLNFGGPNYTGLLNFTQNFSYDGVNRLTSVTDSGGWSQSFGYDQYGNMWNTGNSRLPTLPMMLTAGSVFNDANQITGNSYDYSGNQISFGGDTLSYDAENRLIQANESAANGGGIGDYFYDGLGQRVEKLIMGDFTTVYVYDAFGQMVAEYSSSPEVGTPICATCYLSFDHLGSTRLVTDGSANIVARHDWTPFGGEVPGGMAGRLSEWGSDDGVSQKFTGQIRDFETGQDFFNARYFANAQGRFNSPDPMNAGADLSDPQTWNAYSYVRNNPLNSVDPSGACDVAIYGITMNPGDSSSVTNFSANKIAVFPYEGTNVATGVAQVIGGGGDVNAAIQGIRSAIAQTSAGQSVNIFTFSGGAQTLASAWGSLTSTEQSSIGSITYSIPGSFTGAFSFSGTLPRGSTNPMMIFANGSYAIPSGAPSEPYDTAWSTSCGHDVNCILRTQAALLQQRSGSPCSTPRVLPTPQKQPPANSGSKGGRGGGGGGASSTITYGPIAGGCDIFDLLRLLLAPPPPVEM